MGHHSQFFSGRKMAASRWKYFLCTNSQLSLDTVLVCGQCFRWRKNDLGEWIGVIADMVWRLRQTDDKVFYQVYSAVSDSDQPLDAAEENGALGKKNSLFKCEEKFKSDIDNQEFTKLPEVCYVPQKSGRKRGKNKQRSSSCTLRSTGLVDMVQEPLKLDPSIRLSNSDCIVPNNCIHTAASACVPLSSDRKEIDYKSDDKTVSTVSNHQDILHAYFQLDIDLDELYAHWSAKDDHFCIVSGNFQGIRILRQDPVENLISFVCSSNNHISRITSMVEKLCTHYGNFICQVDGQDFYTFPTLSALSGEGVESNLRQLGFGYRAKYIASIAKHISTEKPGGWLTSLREQSYPEAKAELMTLLGVGAKVADCVCLMSLDKCGAIPVDTHVWQITMKHYMPKLQAAKSLTEKLYKDIGDFYRNLWGPYAGWAHSVLFTADLKQNKDKSPVEMTVKSKQKLSVKPASKKARK